ncbi:TauD/TfdA family dioxygenase [Streptomyces sp. Li-HN-5-11]|uniref:TauD/TfdA family dioxygenase n=1 Tax=Streptomyces sp. Li-HN-5-11 TaxID=3075432 RepID=UPI0028AA320D|nr:TauD/TfdA family dioxygenase [Streptomyces sp. Li-HN-5-11]WNM30385.1 TauD/TfdA family dioxygenase [Streptomyces sp. Li-HN-5-11]
MSINSPSRPVLGKVRRRQAVGAGSTAVTVESAEGRLPAVVRAGGAGADLADWLANNRETLDGLLHRNGGVVFRDFGIQGPEGLERLVLTVSPEAMNYVYGSTPRTREKRQVYTSTEYPANQSIPLHNEMAYATTWPMRLWFLCHKAALTGGATPIADSRRIYARIPEDIRSRFAEQGVMYVRNYGHGLDLTWQDAFETEDPNEVEAYCREAGIEFSWLGEQRLRTKQVAQAVVRHPVTGEWSWFNQAHLFHTASLPAEVRSALLSALDPFELPRNALYGDGTPIEDEVVAAIHQAFEAELVAEPWGDGDVMLIDNVLTAHGREPFTGPRKVLVSMAEPASSGFETREEQR